MNKLSTLKKRWLKDPAVKNAYKKMSFEFVIAHQLITERLKANLTQEEMAQKMGTTQSVIARLERGTQLPTFKTIERYARALGKIPEIRFKTDSH